MVSSLIWVEFQFDTRMYLSGINHSSDVASEACVGQMVQMTYRCVRLLVWNQGTPIGAWKSTFAENGSWSCSKLEGFPLSSDEEQISTRCSVFKMMMFNLTQVNNSCNWVFYSSSCKAFRTFWYNSLPVIPHRCHHHRHQPHPWHLWHLWNQHKSSQFRCVRRLCCRLWRLGIAGWAIHRSILG